ncbi:MAG: protein kinase [Azoarcus sp.]|jgi:serine/threonine protein kinase|nr:protein kinase [Azoarcus sp.]
MMPENISRYEIRRLIGAGATSSVYLAWDPFHQREVAIKQLEPDCFNTPHRGHLFRQLFLNEAALAGKLVHPHIAQIHDAVVDESIACVIMEYVPGGTLEPLARPGGLAPFERVLEIIFKCTRALDYAFHQGITHRDIKPANILLAAPGGSDIRITDFGASLHSASAATQIVNLGSPAYMSPQQVREMPIDHRSDIYSLGVVMYQLLTGHLPFETDNNYTLIYRIANEPPPPLIGYRPEIPEALDAIVRRAMEKDIDRRYQSWIEFSHDLALAFRNLAVEFDRESLPDTSKFQSLRGIAFFREFSDAELWEIVGFAQWNQFQPGTIILKEGEAGDYFCFLIAGEARVKRNGILLDVVAIGECFGEIALFAAGKGVRSASVEATAEVRLITIRANALRHASDTCRMHFYKAFLEVLATRLSLASSRIANSEAGSFF